MLAEIEDIMTSYQDLVCIYVVAVHLTMRPLRHGMD
jgi:hypothetical protein